MCNECSSQDYLAKIDDLLSDSSFRFAADTLEGIREWVEEHDHITDKQIDAVENIVGSRE